MYHRASIIAALNQFVKLKLFADFYHDAVVSLSALPHHQIGTITQEERLKVANMNQLGRSPTAILNALQ
jgi:hypothetical protein